MVRAAKVPLLQAQDALEEIIASGQLDENYRPHKEEGFLYIAVNEDIEDYETVDIDLEEKEETKSLREALSNVLTEKEQDKLKTAYDMLGGIAVLEIDEELRHKEELIAQTLLRLSPRIRTVARKDSAHSGELRLQDYKVLAGEDSLETSVVENGIELFMDIGKTYYSVRSSTERKRIAELAEEGEDVLVMFSGCGPFVCVIAKHSPANKVVGVELNQVAHRYAQENIRRNKLENAQAYQGDVRDIVPGLGKFDRIVMPLPHTGHEFLEVAVPALKKKGWIHLYHFATEEEVQAFAKKIPEKLKSLGATGEVKHIQKCGNLGPGTHRWCLDIEATQ